VHGILLKETARPSRRRSSCCRGSRASGPAQVQAREARTLRGRGGARPMPVQHDL